MNWNPEEHEFIKLESDKVEIILRKPGEGRIGKELPEPVVMRITGDVFMIVP